MHCTGKDATDAHVHTQGRKEKKKKGIWQKRNGVQVPRAEGKGGLSTWQDAKKKYHAFSLQVDSCFLLTSPKKGKNYEVLGCTLTKTREGPKPALTTH